MTDYGRLEIEDFFNMGYDDAEKYVLDIMEENGDEPEICWKRIIDKDNDYSWSATEFTYDKEFTGTKLDCLFGIYNIYADKEFEEIESEIAEQERIEMEREYQRDCCVPLGKYYV